ncbi:glycoside hydrolase family 25 protein [Niameybacter sp.]|uniref:glycoside hydrolase family 25 protein n=1 Tax=Niameybacter sp. TaxID=2033640 RepID=UPI002FC75BFA
MTRKQITRLIIIAAVLYLCGTVVSLRYRPELDGIEYEEIPSIEYERALPRHSYKWEALETYQGKKSYQYDNIKAKWGIDVSKHQEKISWQKVKKDGIDFAMIRVGYRGYGNGAIKEDPTFTYNMNSANRVGIDVGLYFFSQAISVEEAKEEAQFVLQQIQGHKVTYPIVFDMEFVAGKDRITHLTREEKTQITKAFCEVIEQAGYKPMIYGSRHWLQDVITLEELSDYEVWLAEYSDVPSFPYAFKMWQYTDSGTVDGISGGVDMNLWFVEE